MKSPSSNPQLLTAAQERALQACWWSAEGVWWHDLPPGTRDVLLRRKLIKQIGKNPGCNTPGHTHPGYMIATARGGRLIEKLRAERG